MSLLLKLFNAGLASSKLIGDVIHHGAKNKRVKNYGGILSDLGSGPSGWIDLITKKKSRPKFVSGRGRRRVRRRIRK